MNAIPTENQGESLAGISDTGLEYAVKGHLNAMATIESRNETYEDECTAMSMLEGTWIGTESIIGELAVEASKTRKEIWEAELKLRNSRETILRILTSGQDPEIERRMTYLRSEIRKIVGETLPGEKTERFNRALSGNDRTTLKGFWISDADIDFLRSQLRKKDRFEATMKKMNPNLLTNTNSQL